MRSNPSLPRPGGRARLSRTVLASLLALVVVPVTALPAVAAEPAGLILNYDFDGDLTSGTVIDRSASGLDGTLVNPTGAGTVTGPDGSRALSLPGGATDSATAPYVNIPNGLFRGRDAVTVSVWLNWAGGPDFQWVYNLGRDAGTATFVTPSFAGDATTRSSIKPVNGDTEVGVPGLQKLPTGQWLNLVTTIDGEQIVFYINGAETGRTAAALDLDAVMHADGNSTSGFLGKPFWGGHPFLAGALDDVRVYDSALSPEQVAGLAGDRLATLTSVEPQTSDVVTYTGVAPQLPPTVTARFSDGIRRGVTVDWDPVSPQRYAKAGTVSVTGTAHGTTVRANVTVVDNRLTVDLATSTGAFHGGASGTLYGVYGEGLPTSNLLEGMNLRTVSTKAQDGPQHPGADALEVVKPLTDATGGDVYIYMTDIYRGFPYQWPGATPQARLGDFLDKIDKQAAQVAQLAPKYRDHVVFVPFNEPEGNMFGDGQWSYNGVNWLSDPQYFLQAWDQAYAVIKKRVPDARIAGPNTSVLYDRIQDFLRHTVAAGTLPAVMTWHELSDPARIRTSVARYRTWEAAILGTKRLPININEYAFNYHTSVPGQMIQWVSAIEESKVDADIAYWNIDGNLSDSAVQANRGNGQWWLLNAYGQMTGDTVKVTPPRPDVSYTLQGVATLDKDRKQVRAIVGGTDGDAEVRFDNIDPTLFGGTVHALVQEIPWTGQIGDSAQPKTVAELDTRVRNGSAVFAFGRDLPATRESSAYQIILTPGRGAGGTAEPTDLWHAGYEAEDAAHTGSTYRKEGPQGSPSNVGQYYTSGGYNVGGLHTGADTTIDFTVDVPRTGTYDLSVFAGSLNTADAVRDQGPTNVFVRVDGAAEQQIHLPLSYRWLAWDHTDTTVRLAKGRHMITLATRSLDGTEATRGDALLDRIDLTLPNPAAATAVYQAEYATLDGARTSRDGHAVSVGRNQSATFWVYAPGEGEATIDLIASGGRSALQVNGQDLTAGAGKAFLTGGVNKITVRAERGAVTVDRLQVRHTTGTLKPTWYEAETARTAGTATVAGFPLAAGGKAVTGIGGGPGNGNTLTFDVTAAKAGAYALTIRYSNPEQSPASHYNPDPLARHADISVNGGTARRTWFPHSFHAGNFWELSIPVTLKKGANTVTFAAQELPNFDGSTYASQQWPDLLLRSKLAPIVDRIAVTPLAG